MPNYDQNGGPDSTRVPGLLNMDRGAQIGVFDQSTFREKLGVKIGFGAAPVDRSKYRNRPLGDGYCAGVCLDWIRRVLLSRPERDERYLTYQYEALESQSGRTRDSQNTLRSRERSRELAHQTVQSQADAYALSNSLTWYGASESRLKPDEFKKEAARLDVFFDKQRRLNKRDASKKHFSDLALVASKASNYSSPTQWMNELLGSSLMAGCASYLGFGAAGGGHAVTVWQRKASVNNPDSFYFFDPNFGVYAYSKPNLQEAIKILFWLEPGHIPFYHSCASTTAQRLKVMIFGPPRCVDAVPVITPSVPAPTPTAPTLTATVRPTTAPTHTPTPTPTVRPTPTLTPTPTVQPTPAPTPPSTYGAATIPFSVPLPGNNAPPRSPTPSAGGKLSDELQLALDTLPKKAKARGKEASRWAQAPTYDGWVDISVELTKKIVAAAPQQAKNLGLEGTRMSGTEPVERGGLASLIKRLREAGM